MRFDKFNSFIITQHRHTFYARLLSSSGAAKPWNFCCFWSIFFGINVEWIKYFEMKVTKEPMDWQGLDSHMSQLVFFSQHKICSNIKYFYRFLIFGRPPFTPGSERWEVRTVHGREKKCETLILFPRPTCFYNIGAHSEITPHPNSPNRKDSFKNWKWSIRDGLFLSWSGRRTLGLDSV